MRGPVAYQGLNLLHLRLPEKCLGLRTRIICHKNPFHWLTQSCETGHSSLKVSDRLTDHSESLNLGAKHNVRRHLILGLLKHPLQIPRLFQIPNFRITHTWIKEKTVIKRTKRNWRQRLDHTASLKCLKVKVPGKEQRSNNPAFDGSG